MMAGADAKKQNTFTIYRHIYIYINLLCLSVFWPAKPVGSHLSAGSKSQTSQVMALAETSLTRQGQWYQLLQNTPHLLK